MLDQSPPSAEFVRLAIEPVTFAEAKRFIAAYHRHHGPPQGMIFCLAVSLKGQIVAVATCGRPVSRMLDDGFTIEVTRLCTDGTPHAASKLYAACRKAAAGLGYRRTITYTLESEKGTSLQAAGWKPLGLRGGGQWSRPSRPRATASYPIGQKMLWISPRIYGDEA